MTMPTPAAGPAAPPRRRWRVVIAVAVAVALVATVTVVTLRAGTGPRLVSGTPRAAAGTEAPSGGGDARAHEPEQVAELAPGRYPKDYGRISSPDSLLIETHGDTGFIAYSTFKIVHVTAFDLTDGEVTWTKDLGLSAPIGATSMTATDAGLLFVINPQGYAEFSIVIDLETGDDIWHMSKPNLSVSGVVSNHLVLYDSDKDTVNVNGMAEKGGELTPVYQVAADGGRMSEVYQDSAAARRLPRDDGDGLLTFDVGTDPAEDQYLVHAVRYSGALAVRDLATGKALAEGNAGEKMVDVVAYEDTVYVYRQTPRTLAAYTTTDLSRPKWSIQTPAAADGSDLSVCAENLLCLMTVTPQGTPITAIDATSGEQRWQTADYRVATAPAMAGETVAVGHRGGTTLLDPESGDVVTEFDTGTFVLPGDGAVIGFHESEIQLLEPGETKPRSLGEVPDPVMPAGKCEWTSEVAVCPGEETYRLWRYRG